jgi:hypothetical protein
MNMIKAVLFSFGFVALFAFVGTIESTDRITAQVIDVQNDVVFVKDNRGHVFSFYGNNFKNGEKVTVVFFNGGNTDIRDDKIVDVIK